MPCGGLTPFLPTEYMCRRATQSIVSMPCGGLTPFLQIYELRDDPKLIWCQCPVAGLLHFYEETLCHCECGGGGVSMPCGGLTPFLLFIPRIQNFGVGCVNALWRANSISTTLAIPNADVVTNVSMPCGGLTPFLQLFELTELQGVTLCQCPVAG